MWRRHLARPECLSLPVRAANAHPTDTRPLNRGPIPAIFRAVTRGVRAGGCRRENKTARCHGWGTWRRAVLVSGTLALTCAIPRSIPSPRPAPLRAAIVRLAGRDVRASRSLLVGCSPSLRAPCPAWRFAHPRDDWSTGRLARWHHHDEPERRARALLVPAPLDKVEPVHDSAHAPPFVRPRDAAAANVHALWARRGSVG